MAGSASAKGAVFPSAWRRYADPSTELPVYQLTDPASASALPAYYNRAVARNSASLLFRSDRGGSPQAFLMDLRSGGTRQLTQTEDLDGDSLTLLPGDRSFCYFAGRRLCVTSLASLSERTVYAVPEGRERGIGSSVTPDGTHTLFIEREGGLHRLRIAPLARGAARSVVEASYAIADPIARPQRDEVLYRQGDAALWLARSDGSDNGKLRLAPGGIGPANWSPGGDTILYLSLPEDRRQLSAIREYAPETGADKLVAKTSQYAHFGFNRDTSVFVGASRNAASPVVLIMLRVNGRELTLCEHKASRPEMVAPIFSPDAQRVYFQSDRGGKPAIYSVRVERLVEKIQDDNA
jgi:oligogalacturonide lyase